jgi:hypothetical protein
MRSARCGEGNVSGSLYHAHHAQLCKCQHTESSRDRHTRQGDKADQIGADHRWALLAILDARTERQCDGGARQARQRRQDRHCEGGSPQYQYRHDRQRARADTRAQGTDREGPPEPLKVTTQRLGLHLKIVAYQIRLLLDRHRPALCCLP